MEYQGLSFVEAINELAKMVGMQVPQEERQFTQEATKQINGLQDALQLAAQYYKAELKKAPRAIEYLKARGVSGVIAAKYQIGYAPAGWQNLQTVFRDYGNTELITAGLVVKNDQGKLYDRFRDRIMFPIHNQKGEVIGFGGRVINPDDSPKYYNSPETPLFQKGHELYGLFAARRAIREAERALVVEGYMDVVALAQYGIEYSVAALGTATTPYHIAKLMRQTHEIVFCFDGDQAGRTAAWRAVMNTLPALNDALKLKFLLLPPEHDPDSYVREFGKAAFEQALADAMPLSQYILKHLCENNPLQTQEDKVKFLNEAEPILQLIKAPRNALFLQKKIAEYAQLSTEEVKGLLKLPALNQESKPFKPKLTRTTISLKKRFCLLMIMRPHLVEEHFKTWLQGKHAEDILLHNTLEICLENPQAKPVAIMHALANIIDSTTYNDLQFELQRLDESLDLDLEFNGALQQLTQLYVEQHQSMLSSSIVNKPLHLLTDDERNLLKTLGSKSSQK